MSNNIFSEFNTYHILIPQGPVYVFNDLAIPELYVPTDNQIHINWY